MSEKDYTYHPILEMAPTKDATPKDYDFRAIRVKSPTFDRFREQRRKADMSATEYTNYLLNLGAAYPPTLDYQCNQVPKELNA